MTMAPTMETPVHKYGTLWVDTKSRHLVSTKTLRPVQLVGVSLYWSNPKWGGSHFWNRDVVRELASWPGLSIIRCSFGVEKDGGYMDDPKGNLERLRTVVDAAIEFGIYVIICWHSHKAEDPKSFKRARKFFPALAKEYRKSPNVLFAIYNEPVHTSWDQIVNYTYNIVPMIRKYSNAVIILGTPQWSQRPEWVAHNDTLTGIDNLIYSVHFYAASWGHQFIKDRIHDAIKSIPLIADEWGHGCPDILCPFDFNKTMQWIKELDYYQISHLNWVLNDKEGFVDSTLSILKRGASPHGGWTDDDFTDAGLATKAIISRYGPDPPSQQSLQQFFNDERFSSGLGIDEYFDAVRDKGADRTRKTHSSSSASSS